VVALLLMTLLVGHLAATPYIDSAWLSERDGDIELAGSRLPPLRAMKGAHLSHLSSADGQTLHASGTLLLRSSTMREPRASSSSSSSSARCCARGR